jgi:quercetin dioxygenase-like cupin family protein
MNGNKDPQAIDWEKHPKFEGVYLKTLLKGLETDKKFSCHLVKIDPGCRLDYHTHGENIELHEVIRGEGRFKLNSVESTYRPGTLAVIPKGNMHRVIADNGGLLILAKFFPALA